MAEATFIVEDVVKDTAKNNKPYVKIMGWSQIVFCWDLDLLPEIRQGDKITVVVSEGEYANLIACKLVERQATLPTSQPVSEKKATQESRILKSVALKAAADCYKENHKVGDDPKMFSELVISLAEFFEAYLLGETS